MIGKSQKGQGFYALAVLLILSLGIVFAPEADAKERKRKGGQNQAQNVEKRVEHLTKKLDLSEDQQTQLTAILEANQAEIQALREEYSDDRENLKEALKTQRESTDSRIIALLDNTQAEKYAELKDKRQKRKRKNRNE